MHYWNCILLDCSATESSERNLYSKFRHWQLSFVAYTCIVGDDVIYTILYSLRVSHLNLVAGVSLLSLDDGRSAIFNLRSKRKI